MEKKNGNKSTVRRCLYALILVAGIITVRLTLLQNQGARNFAQDTKPAYKTVVQHPNRNLTQNTNSIASYCTDTLNNVRFGKWRKKDGLTKADQEKRMAANAFQRKFRGIPNPVRSDSRCGAGFPVPAPAFGPSLPSICQESSTTPCCNENSGMCGIGKENCQCEKCTDFREIISAELYNWVPENKTCLIKQFTSESACEAVSNRISNLTILGDSLMRHFFNALLILFTGDPEKGAYTKQSEKQNIDCSGERQFIDRGKGQCHGKLARNRDDITEGKFCRGSSRYFSFKLNEAWAVHRKNEALTSVNETLGKPHSVIVLGIGLHDGLNAQRIMDGFLEPMLQLIGDNDWPKLVWVTTHDHGFLKPPAYRESQSSNRILGYNTKMRELLEPRGVPIFDVFRMTSGVFSYDGTHYGMGANMAKAQMLVNYIEEAFEKR